MARTTSARQSRAVVLASASFALGLAGHQQAGGHHLSPESLAFAAAYCLLASLAYSRRHLSGPAVAAILFTNQVVVHVGLTLGASGSGPHAGHGVDGLVPGPWMIVAHLAATVLTAATIVVVEASYLVCTSLLNRIGRAGLLSPTPPRGPRSVRCGTAYRTAFWHSRHPGSVPGRGPPLLAAV
jgi:hypothetical protein